MYQKIARTYEGWNKANSTMFHAFCFSVSVTGQCSLFSSKQHLQRNPVFIKSEPENLFICTSR